MKTTLETVRKHAGENGAKIDSGFNMVGNTRIPVMYYFGALLPEKWCDEVNTTIRHRGWFTDHEGLTYKDGTGICRGIVVELPSRPGFPEGVFLSGYHMGGTGERVVWYDCYRIAEEAADSANGYAEQVAEMEREYSQRSDDARSLHDKIEGFKKRHKELTILRGCSGLDYVRSELNEVSVKIRDGLRRLKTEYSDIDIVN